MKFLKYFLYLFIFLLVGEVIIRFDKEFAPFENDDVVKIPQRIGESEELTMLKSGKVPSDENVLRIMVLGDSYIYGGGIDFNKNFSRTLKSLLQKSELSFYKQIYILDVSRPSNNNLDNYKTYFEYVEKFNPQIVVLGYNINDTEGNLDTSVIVKNGSKAVKNANINTTTARKIYNVIYKSETVHYVMSNLNKYLKSHGIVVPNSVFDEELKAYTLNKPRWEKSKQLLNVMLSDANHRDIMFMPLLLPNMSLINYPGLFKEVDVVISDYFKAHPKVTFVNIREIFSKEDPNNFVLSKYDQHPNEKGHYVMAELASTIIKENLLKIQQVKIAKK